MAASLATPNRGSQLDSLRSAIALRDRATTSHRGNGNEPTVLVCASGRGGSGTSLVSVLLALSAAGDGHKTLLIDGDDLVGPHAMLLGVTPAVRWPELLGGGVHATQLATEIAPTLALVAGGRSAADASSLSIADRRACFTRLHSLAESYALVVIDAGSRLDTMLAAIDSDRIDARLVIVTAGSDPITIASSYALLKAAHTRRPHIAADVLCNRLPDAMATRVADTLAHGAEQFLARPLAFAGAIPHDTALDAALRAGMPFLDAVTGSPVAVAAHDTVLRMMPAVSTSRSGD